MQGIIMGYLKSTIFKYDPTIYKDLSIINIHRIHVMGWIMGLINIVHVVIFWLNIPSNPDHVVRWYELIIIIHSIMLFTNGILGFTSFWIEKKRKQSHKIGYVIQCLSIFANLLFGILLCVSDQLVTTNINPLLIACIGVGVIFLIPPIVSVVFYSVTFFLFFNLVTWTQHIPELLEHIRINSVTAAGMGFGVSWVLWRNNLLRNQQQAIIEDQKRKLEEKNEYLQFVATRDPLTGLLNRVCFRELVNTELLKHGSACMVLLDIDFFKQINDNYGHPAGDGILKETAKISTLRRSDIAARLGGEEFIILLPETNLQNGREVAEKLRRKIQDYSFQTEGQILKITASFGIAELTNSFDTCYSQADQALYTAKKNGRNCTVIAEHGSSIA